MPKTSILHGKTKTAIPFEIKDNKKGKKNKSLSSYLSWYANKGLISKESGILEIEAHE